MTTRIYDLLPDRWSLTLVFGRDAQAMAVSRRLLEVAPASFATMETKDIQDVITRPSIILDTKLNARSNYALVKTIRSKSANVPVNFIIPIVLPRMASKAVASTPNLIVLCDGLTTDDLRNICTKRTADVIRVDALRALYNQYVDRDNVLVINTSDTKSGVYCMPLSQMYLVPCNIEPVLAGPLLHMVVQNCSINVVISRDRRRVHEMLHNLTCAYERKHNHLVHYLDMETDHLDDVVLSVSDRWTNVLLLDNVPCAADRFSSVRDTLRNLIQNTKTIVFLGVQFEAPTICDFVRRRNRNYARGFGYNVIMGPEMTRTRIYTRMGLTEPPDVQIDKYDWDFCACNNDYTDCVWRVVTKSNDTDWSVVQYISKIPFNAYPESHEPSYMAVNVDTPESAVTVTEPAVESEPSEPSVNVDTPESAVTVPELPVPEPEEPVIYSLAWRDQDGNIVGRTRFDGNVQLFQRGTLTESGTFAAESDWFQQPPTPPTSIFGAIYRSLFG